jgi:serine protease AprX
MIRTVNDPPGMYMEVFSVGALGYQSATIASYSSRGPVTVDGSNVPKPEISAPGYEILFFGCALQLLTNSPSSTVRSCYPTNAYTTMSGTSMASPHITGIIPLVWQAKPSLARNILHTVAL